MVKGLMSIYVHVAQSLKIPPKTQALTKLQSHTNKQTNPHLSKTMKAQILKAQCYYLQIAGLELYRIGIRYFWNEKCFHLKILTSFHSNFGVRFSRSDLSQAFSTFKREKKRKEE